MSEKVKKLPGHVAVIMDGNGRWAEREKVSRVTGHNQGMLAMKEIIKKADMMGIKYLTVYAFSTENWKRSREEIGGIFGLLVKFVASELKELNENNVRVHILGDYHERVPENAIQSIDRALATTRDNDGLQFNIALNYGSRAEIVRAVQRIVDRAIEEKSAEAGGPETTKGEFVVTDEMISRELYTGNENGNIPDPDLIIRTSGEERLSNFLLWQAAYSEFAFTDTLWPDFKPEEFEEIIHSYMTRERRYGGR